MKKIIALLLAFVLCASLTACKKSPGSNSGTNNGQITPEDVFANAEKLDYNPLTGEALAKGVSAGQRPVAVMVNNARPALPQRGIAAADAMIEMVTEGGVTRLMTLYADPAAMPQVGPVRSARDQHLQFAIPLNAIVAHIGSSVYAENLLNTYGYQGVDGRYLGTQAFTFDSARATTRASEHCWYTDAALLAAGVQTLQIPTTGKSYPLLPFAERSAAPKVLTDGEAPDVAFRFSNDNEVQFTYSAETGLYAKKAYGEPHVDETTGEQVAFKNVFVLFVEIGYKPDAYCSDFNLSSGNGYYLYEGKYQEILWQKGAPETPLQITTPKGKEIKINPGKTYLGFTNLKNMDTLRMDVNAPVTSEAADASSAPASTPAAS